MSLVPVALALAALCAGPLASLPVAEPGPTCRALLKGSRLTTTLELSNGYRLQAAWNVLGYVRPADSSDPTEVAADLLLQSITESDPVTGQHRTIAPPEPLRVQAVAGNQVDALQRAADSWCSTVGRATLEGIRLRGIRLPRPTRVT